MKPKMSSGYLTPQAKKIKNAAKPNLSVAEECVSENVIDNNVFANLMKCPEKKNMILQFLAANKDAIEDYKKKEESPVRKVTRKPAYESPTALFRRRALEQMNSSPSSSNRSSDSRPTSRTSDITSNSTTSRSVAFDKILAGVIAYVEINNNGQDRSSGAKAVLRSMGAKIRERFTNDVTHVIFKDGCFTTFEKAKLLKIHFVSILWVEFCRKTMKRQPEKLYPALKTGFDADNETSLLCSQMEKEYKEIIREEYRRSIADGTPLPTTRSLINRRRTIMTPSFSNLSSSTVPTVFDSHEPAVSRFNSSQRQEPEEILILNDPDSSSDASGAMVNGRTIERRNSIVNCILKSANVVEESSDMDITETNISKSISDQSSGRRQSRNDSDMELTNIINLSNNKIITNSTDIYREKTPKLPSNCVPTKLFQRKSICNPFLSSDSSSLISSDRTTNITDDFSFAIPTTSKNTRKSSSFLDSNESFQFGRNKAKSRKVSSADCDVPDPAKSDKNSSKSSSKMSHLQLSSENTYGNKRRSSRISSALGSKEKVSEKSSSMSNLCISTEKEPLTTDKANKENVESSHMSDVSSENDRKMTGASSMSSLRVSTQSKRSSNASKQTDSLLEKRPIRQSLAIGNENNENVGSSRMSSLHVSSENDKQIDTSSMSSLRVSTQSKRSSNVSKPTDSLLEKEPIRQSLATDKENNENVGSSRMSSLRVSSENDKKIADASSMSSLQVSAESKRSSKELKRANSLISSLNLFSEKNKKSSTSNISFSSLEEGNSGILKEIVENVIETLKTPDPDKQKKMSSKRSASSESSDNSEIISPAKNPRRTARRATAHKDREVDINFSDNELSQSRELELLSTVTKRRKTLGTRRRTTQKFDEKDQKSINLQNENQTSGLGRKTRKSTRMSTKLQKPVDQSNSQVLKSVDNETSSKPVDNQLPNISSDSSELSDRDHQSNGKKKLRKLYNPYDPIPVIIDDDEERKQKRLEAKNRKSGDQIFMNPFHVLADQNMNRNKSTTSDCESNEPSPVKRTRKKKKDSISPILDSSADEQKELFNEVIGKKNKVQTPESNVKNLKPAFRTPKVRSAATIKNRRKSERLIKSSQKFACDTPKTPITRRSSLDFQPITKSNKKPKKVDPSKLPTIVCTKLHRSEVEVFSRIVKKLGRFVVENEVSNRTTHLVAGESKRTINMLRAISRGCWVLKYEWVLKSLEAGKWLSEEDFEVSDFSPTVQKSRLERQAFGPKYSLDVFENCPPIYIAPHTDPRCSDLRELVEICKGTVVTVRRMARIAVGEYLEQDDTISVNVTWVLDSITFNKKMPFGQQYLLKKASENKRKSTIV